MQVEDDPELLELMLKDTRSAGSLYRPTNYWAVYEKTFLPQLRRLGLRDFASRKNSVLSSFGATDLGSTASEEEKRRVFDWAAGLGRRLGARPLEELELSLVGNPKELIRYNGKEYPASALRYYLEYAYCCQFVDFDQVSILVELGSGAGKQAEVIKKLHPEITFLLFDIPPQLYVAEQYLKTVFPESVLSYRQTRQMESLTGILQTRPRKICLLGNWKFPLVGDLSFDLFWNAASFQEMEPAVVANYLHFVRGRAEAVFLHQMMGGKEVARRPGKHGVLRKTTLEQYKNGLAGYDLIDLSSGLLPFHGASADAYRCSFWRLRRSA